MVVDSLRHVKVFDSNGKFVFRFDPRNDDAHTRDRLTVSGRKMLLLDNIVDVHELTGDFVCSFGRGVLNSTTGITATCDGRIMIVDPGDSCVHLFTVEGQQLVRFNYNKIKGDCYYRIACHPIGQHIVLTAKKRKTDRLALAVYTVDGEFE